MSIEQHRRVLVVDDDPMIRDLLGAVLRQRALHVDSAADGREAIDLLREHTYAVVLLDLMMPGVDGFSVLRAIRADEITGAPPVVLVVTGADRGTIEQLDAQMIHGIIRKPFDPHEVASIVAACSDIRGRSAFETMAIAMMSGPLLAWLSSQKW
jgi:CheY-like chemotaxis protein